MKNLTHDRKILSIEQKYLDTVYVMLIQICFLIEKTCNETVIIKQFLFFFMVKNM